ncbi:MAG TPA: TetR/AcrR family transcriptional regulator [Rhodanobacteraceae bacterium]|nr:TetR/AcrR family transcriptional regulator [Rhodanobacteraceae bacterium]
MPPRKTPLRPPGRPANAAAGGQRERLLDAAIALFAHRGVAGTSLGEIARRAHATPALVHYYFGNRDQLLDALVNERIAPLVATLGRRVSESGADASSTARTFVSAIVAMLAEHEWLPPLWIREVLTDDGALRERLMARIAPEIAPHLARRFADAKREGALNPGLDPRLTVVSLIGLTIFPLAAQSIWKRLLDADDVDADALTRHTLALLEGGIGSRSRARPRKSTSRRRREHREAST